MRTPAGNKIESILRQHIGRENAITAPQIARALNWTPTAERDVRRIIADERILWAAKIPGILVCAVPGHGFFCAEDYEEALLCRGILAGLSDQAREKLEVFDGLCGIFGFKFSEDRRAA